MEAPIKWKVNLLKEVRDSARGVSFIPEPDTNELEWFLDMKRDGLICGDWGTTGTLEDAIKQNSIIPTGGKSGFHFLTVPEKGKKFIEDYESQNTWHGIWKRYHIAILIWIVTVASAIVIECLRTFYF